MRRLTSTARRGILRRARGRDRGAAAAWVGIIAVPVLVIAALGIDVGTMHVAQQRLQTGADAAALAAAADCGGGVCLPLTAELAAQQLATANAPLDGAADATILELDRDGRYVEVQVSSETEHAFGPVVGIGSTTQTATAAATWGYPTQGRVVMPLAVSWCELRAALGVGMVTDLLGNVVGGTVPAGGAIRKITLSPAASLTLCLGPIKTALTRGLLPGGLQWLDLGSGCGDTVVELGVWTETNAESRTPPAGCTNADFSKWLGRTVYIPVYADIRGLSPITGALGLGGANAAVNVQAFVAFRLTAYQLGDGFSGGTFVQDPPGPPGVLRQTGCPGLSCIQGEFELGLDLSVGSQPPGDFEYGEGTGVSVGEPAVQLVLPEEGRP